MKRDYGEMHEYVIVNGRKHYVIHPSKPKIKPRLRPRLERIKFKLGGGI